MHETHDRGPNVEIFEPGLGGEDSVLFGVTGLRGLGFHIFVEDKRIIWGSGFGD